VNRFCRFHHGQSWFRKPQSLGLAMEYRPNSATAKFLQHIFGLSLLDAEGVRAPFAFDLMSDAPDDDRVVKFMDYLLDHYISDAATFPPSKSAKSSPSESFHAAFNASFYHHQPGIFAFIATVIEFQVRLCVKCRSACVSAKPPNENEVLKQQ
jgi:hypothetical protein